MGYKLKLLLREPTNGGGSIQLYYKIGGCENMV